MSDYRDKIYAHYQTVANSRSVTLQDFETALPVYRALYRHLLPTAKDAPILDVGCGFGRFLYFLQKEGYHNAEGVDVSPEQVELARKHGVQEIHLDHFSPFLRGRTAHYACVTAFDVIEHCKKDEVFSLLESVHQALMPDGTVIIATANASSLFHTLIRYGDFTHEVCFTAGSMRQVLGAVGFRDIRIAPMRIPVVSLKTFIRRFGWALARPWLKALISLEAGSGAAPVILEQSLIATARK